VAELRQQLQKKETREIQEGKKRAREEFEELKEKVRQLENWTRRSWGRILVLKILDFSEC